MNTTETYEIIKKTLDLWLPEKIAYENIPGVAVRVSHKGKLVYANAFGYADIEKRLKMKKDALFRVASMSKMFASVAILQLAEQGRLSLGSRVSKTIEEFRTSDLEKITVRDLLAHRAGVFRDSNKDYWDMNVFTDDVLSDVNEKTKVLRPREHFKYSNFGFSILGKVIEAVTGQKYNEYIDENIIKKLKLKNTHPDYSEDLDSGLALGYSRRLPDEKRYSFKHSNTGEYSPATGLVSTTEDITAFLYDITSGRSKLLSESSIKKVLSPVSKIDSDSAYGLGFDIEFIDGKKAVGHGGGYNGYTTRALILPKDGISVVVFTNCIGGRATTIATNIFRLFDWFTVLKPIKQMASVSEYEGVYRDQWSDICVVGAGRDLIAFNPVSGNPFKPKVLLKQVSADSFRITGDVYHGSLEEEVIFKDIKNGKAQTMIWAGGTSRRIR